MSLGIYFCGSIRAGRDDVPLYGRLVTKLNEFGRVLTAFVADPAIMVTGSEHEGGDRAIHDRDVQWLEEADCEFWSSIALRRVFLFNQSWD